jgi:hypothetical protein
MYWLELVSKELNHLAAILHVYARQGFDFLEVRKYCYYIKKEKGNTFTFLIMQGFDFLEVKKYCYYISKRKGKYFYIFNHFYSKKSSKRTK